GPVETVLDDPGIEIVVNLTIPAAHFEVSSQILEAGKHIWSEKPLTTTREDASALLALARERDLRVGGAPDAVLGAGVRSALPARRPGPRLPGLPGARPRARRPGPGGRLAGRPQPHHRLRAARRRILHGRGAHPGRWAAALRLRSECHGPVLLRRGDRPAPCA